MASHQQQHEYRSLESAWPPDWMTTYSDMATLLMTFFIILSTMLALKIDIRYLGEDYTESSEEQAPLDVSVVTELTPEDQNLIKTFRNLDEEQLRELARVSRMEQLGKDIQQYILEAKLSGFIKVDISKWKITIVPLTPFLFPSGRTTLRPTAREFLDRIADFIKLNPCHVRILGHADNRPIHNARFPSNWELSVDRAAAIMRYLIEKHALPPQKLSSIGYGHHRPIASNDTPEGRAKNRRVEIEITQKAGSDSETEY